MRLPYVPDPPPTSTEEEAALVERIRARRAPRPLIALDRTLLHSHAIADGWNHFVGNVRTKTSIPDDVREFAISRVAVCNRAWYEWGSHAPLALKAGVSQEGIQAIKEENLPEQRPDALSDKFWAVALYTDEMTKNVQVSDETFAKVKAHFNDQEVVELTSTIACYNMVSRFLVALDVGERNGTGPEDVVAAH